MVGYPGGRSKLNLAEEGNLLRIFYFTEEKNLQEYWLTCDISNIAIANKILCLETTY